MNNLINSGGVGRVHLANVLSTSKARTSSAPPNMLTSTANISVVYPKTLPTPPMSSRTPGRPKKNLEYFGSYATILRYLPSTAYEYSTERLTFMTTRLTDTTGSIPCMTGITDSSSSPSETITAPVAGNLLITSWTSRIIFSSAATPLSEDPATVTTSALYPRLTRSSYVLIAANIELEVRILGILKGQSLRRLYAGITAKCWRLYVGLVAYVVVAVYAYYEQPVVCRLGLGLLGGLFHLVCWGQFAINNCACWFLPQERVAVETTLALHHTTAESGGVFASKGGFGAVFAKSWTPAMRHVLAESHFIARCRASEPHYARDAAFWIRVSRVFARATCGHTCRADCNAAHNIEKRNMHAYGMPRAHVKGSLDAEGP